MPLIQVSVFPALGVLLAALVLAVRHVVTRKDRRPLEATLGLETPAHRLVVRVALREHVPPRPRLQDPRHRLQHPSRRDRRTPASPGLRVLRGKVVPDPFPLPVRQLQHRRAPVRVHSRANTDNLQSRNSADHPPATLEVDSSDPTAAVGVMSGSIGANLLSAAHLSRQAISTADARGSGIRRSSRPNSRARMRGAERS